MHGSLMEAEAEGTPEVNVVDTGMGQNKPRQSRTTAASWEEDVVACLIRAAGMICVFRGRFEASQR